MNLVSEQPQDRLTLPDGTRYRLDPDRLCILVSRPRWVAAGRRRVRASRRGGPVPAGVGGLRGRAGQRRQALDACDFVEVINGRRTGR